MARWKDKPQLVTLAGTERIAATSMAGGPKVGGGSVAAEGDIYITAQQLLDAAAEAADDAIEDAIADVGAFAQVMLSDMATDIATGTGKGVWFAPEDGQLVEVWLALHDPSSSGVVRIDMNDSGGSVFTTRPSIDATEATSLSGTAAVLDGTITFSKGDKFTFDIDDAGTDAKGLQVTVGYARL